MSRFRIRKYHPAYPEMINQVLTYLSGLSDQGHTPSVFSAPAPQVQGVQNAADVAPRMDASLEVGTFHRLTIGSIMKGDQHELFIKFSKLKPLVFKVLNLKMPMIF